MRDAQPRDRKEDRTGHRSSQMINEYRRAVRAADELGPGPLLPLDEAIPEFRARGVEAEVETGASKKKGDPCEAALILL